MILAFLAATLLPPLPYSAIALALLLFQVYLSYKPLRAPLELVAILLSLILLPLTLDPLLGWWSALLAIPAIPLLGFSLKENALSQSFPQSTKRRSATITLKSITTTLIIILIISILLANHALTAASALLLIYLIGICVYVLKSTPCPSLEESQTWVRVIAGDTGKATVTLKSRASEPLP